ncbi:MAG: N-acetylmuramoyl-L-alanine amidase [Bacteroides sp.]|nr:N-acetylmuramoyl-L-alanine amidase [Bacteroides sp.]
MRRIDHIVVHCSATREGQHLPPEILDWMHRARGFSGTGYHYYIRRSGAVHNARPIAQIGAHTRGYNHHSIGICYEGGLDARGNPTDTRTPEQRAVLRLLVEQLKRKFPAARVCGHRDLSPDTDGDGVVEPHEWLKQCPCFEVETEL